ncbi:hypothetical protein OAS19_00730, partial [Altererythrobacter sp.]|nr:hypothetical protein [Altererythrobacter sp.]
MAIIRRLLLFELDPEFRLLERPDELEDELDRVEAELDEFEEEELLPPMRAIRAADLRSDAAL